MILEPKTSCGKKSFIVNCYIYNVNCDLRPTMAANYRKFD